MGNVNRDIACIVKLFVKLCMKNVITVKDIKSINYKFSNFILLFHEMKSNNDLYRICNSIILVTTTTGKGTVLSADTTYTTSIASEEGNVTDKSNKNKKIYDKQTTVQRSSDKQGNDSGRKSNQKNEKDPVLKTNKKVASQRSNQQQGKNSAQKSTQKQNEALLQTSVQDEGRVVTVQSQKRGSTGRFCCLWLLFFLLIALFILAVVIITRELPEKEIQRHK